MSSPVARRTRSRTRRKSVAQLHTAVSVTAKENAKAQRARRKTVGILKRAPLAQVTKVATTPSPRTRRKASLRSAKKAKKPMSSSPLQEVDPNSKENVQDLNDSNSEISFEQSEDDETVSKPVHSSREKSPKPTVRRFSAGTVKIRQVQAPVTVRSSPMRLQDRPAKLLAKSPRPIDVGSPKPSVRRCGSDATSREVTHVVARSTPVVRTTEPTVEVLHKAAPPATTKQEPVEVNTSEEEQVEQPEEEEDEEEEPEDVAEEQASPVPPSSEFAYKVGPLLSGAIPQHEQTPPSTPPSKTASNEPIPEITAAQVQTTLTATLASFSAEANALINAPVSVLLASAKKPPRPQVLEAKSAKKVFPKTPVPSRSSTASSKPRSSRTQRIPSAKRANAAPRRRFDTPMLRRARQRLGLKQPVNDRAAPKTKESEVSKEVATPENEELQTQDAAAPEVQVPSPQRDAQAKPDAEQPTTEDAPEAFADVDSVSSVSSNATQRDDASSIASLETQPREKVVASSRTHSRASSVSSKSSVRQRTSRNRRTKSHKRAMSGFEKDFVQVREWAQKNMQPHQMWMAIALFVLFVAVVCSVVFTPTSTYGVAEATTEYVSVWGVIKSFF